MHRFLSASLVLTLALIGCDSGGDGENQIRAVSGLNVADFFVADTQSPSVRPLFDTDFGIPTFASTSSDPSIVAVTDQDNGTIRLVAGAVGSATVSVVATVDSGSGDPVSATSSFTVTVRPQCPQVDPARDVMPDSSAVLYLNYMRGEQPSEVGGGTSVSYRGSAALSPEASCSRGTLDILYRGTLEASRTEQGEQTNVSGIAELRFTGTESEVTSEFIDPFDTAYPVGPGRRTASPGETVRLTERHCFSGQREMVLLPGTGFEEFIMDCTERAPAGSYTYSDTELTLSDRGEN